jgi:hypothetical protein
MVSYAEMTASKLAGDKAAARHGGPHSKPFVGSDDIERQVRA